MIPSADEFVRLRESEDPAEYNRAAQEEASEATWNEVLDRYPAMAKWVAINKTIPESILRRVASTGDPDARLFIAQKRKTPPDVLAALAQDENESVRAAVARHAKTPPEALDALAGDAWHVVREIVAQRRA